MSFGVDGWLENSDNDEWSKMIVGSPISQKDLREIMVTIWVTELLSLLKKARRTRCGNYER